MLKKLSNQAGIIQIFPILVIVAIVGIMGYLMFNSVAPYKNSSLLGNTNPRPLSHAQVVTGVTLNITPSNILPQVNQTFSVTLNLSTDTDNVSAAEIHLKFDPAKLQAQTITKGAFLPVVLSAGMFDNTAGTATITLGSDPTTPAHGTGGVATVTFKAVGFGSSSISYDSTTQTASIGQSTNSLQGTTPATVTVNPPSPSPIPNTPSPLPTPSPIVTPAPNKVTLNISPTTSSITTTGQTTLSLNLNPGGDQVSAAELHLTFNPAIVHIKSITAGTLLPVVLLPGTFDNNAGTASIILGANPTTPVATSGTVATVAFTGFGAGVSSVAYANTTQTASIGKSSNSLSSSQGSSITVTKATPTPSPTPQKSFSAKTTVSPLNPKVNANTNITSTVTAGSKSTVLVDIEIYNAAGQKVFQTFSDNQSFNAGQSRNYSGTWRPTATGQYTLYVGIFNPGWNGMISWITNQASGTVSR